MTCDCCGRETAGTIESGDVRVCLDCWASEGDVDALISPCGVDVAAEQAAWASLTPIACVVADDEQDVWAGL